MSASAASAVDLSLGACLAGLRTALAHVEAAGAAVLADKPDVRAGLDNAVDAANGALRRALAMAVAIRQEMPGHARRARLANRAVERVAEALVVVQRLAVVPFDEEDGSAIHEAMIASATGKAARAIEAAGP